MKKNIRIGNRKVGVGQPVFIIAEIGLNHNGKLETAMRLIDSAARAGVDAVKFQTYITEKRVPKDSPLFEILKKCELPFACFKNLKEYANMKGLIFFSTPFDEDSVACLSDIQTPCYKIASFDVVNHLFLKKIAATRKPVILSVGMSNVKEIKEAHKILFSGSKQIALLHCVSAYPTHETDANLSAISSLRKTFDCVVGQSDHTADIVVPLYAVAVGAQIIEKHFRIDANFECVDKPVSITEAQMKELVIQVRRLERILGGGAIGVSECQKPILPFRRLSII